MIATNIAQNLNPTPSCSPPPIDYSRYLIDLICRFLESFQGLCKIPSGVCRFSIQNFVRHILHQSRISYATVATGLLYLLWCKQALKKNMSKYRKTITLYEVFVASLVLSSKYLNDRNASNSAWSRISGIPLETLNRTEMLLLSVIEYRLHVDVDLFNRWITFLFQPSRMNSYYIQQNCLQELAQTKKQKLY